MDLLHTIPYQKLTFYLPGLVLGYFISRLIPWMWLKILIELPGTIAHELCHFIIAILLNAKPSSFDIIPSKKEDGSWRLGSVTMSNPRWYNALFVGLAPLLIYPAFYFWVPNHWSLLHPQKQDLWIWAWMALLLPSAIPSKTDLMVSLECTPLPIALLAGIGYLASRYLH